MRLGFAPLTAVGLLALIGVDLWFLSLVFGDTAPEAPAAMHKPGPAPIPVDRAGSLPNSKPIMAFAQTMARPVFYKSREPFVPPPPAPPPIPKVAVPPPPPVAQPNFALGGVMITEDAKKAYVVNKATSQGEWLSEGESIMGWTLQFVDTTSAKLQQAERTVELQMYPQR
jgi:hypothetical protein